MQARKTKRGEGREELEIKRRGGGEGKRGREKKTIVFISHSIVSFAEREFLE